MFGKKKEPVEVLTPEEEQKKLLDKAIYKVKCEHYYMNEAFDKKKDFRLGLEHASKMLKELETGDLTPKNYYELYNLSSDKLRDLKAYISGLAKDKKNIGEIYEQVQYVGDIVPRLYLLVTAGVVYIESKQIKAQNILKDLVELCKGEQHPIRGLFLRHHLSTTTKKLIPDIDSEYAGSITDSISYILTNFKETINLFSRLKDLKDDDPEKREEERASLRTLIGTNLIRLSQLEGATKEIYKIRILPALLDTLKSFADVVAQQFVLECIIQVFPDDYHIETLEELLSVIGKLESELNLQPIFTSLLDRLANFALKYPEQMKKEQNMLDIFQKHVQPSSEKMKLEDMMVVKRSLLKLILEIAPEETKYISATLSHLAEQLETAFDKEDKKMTELVTTLIHVPVNKYKDIITILELGGLKEIFQMLAYKERRFIAVELCKTTIKNGKKIVDIKHVETFFDFLAPLLRNEQDYVEPKSKDIFEDGQNLVARVIHLFYNDDTDKLFNIFAKTRKVFGKGGEKRICYTLPPLVFEYMMLAKRIFPVQEEKEFQVVKVLQYILDILNVLANKYPALTFSLYLEAALCADVCHNEQFVYEFLTQAFLLYEESDSKNQVDLLRLMLNTLISLKNFSQDNYDTLSTKTCQYSSKLLRKTDQAIATVLCSHLFYPCKNNTEFKKSGKAKECLEYSLKIVNSCLPNRQIPLLVEILNTYVYQKLTQNETIQTSVIDGLIELIDKDLGNYEEKEKTEANSFVSLHEYYKLTKLYVEMKRKTEMFDEE